MTEKVSEDFIKRLNDFQPVKVEPLPEGMEYPFPDTAFLDDSADHWPETVYRYVEHYKFEPQHLLKGQSTKAFRESIRRQEVPLNFLLNILCVALPSPWIQSMLSSASFTTSEPVPSDLVQRFPAETDYCQSDVRLETSTERVFIECKIKAYSDTEQILKYLLLSAHLDEIDEPKRPWVLYLTPGPFAKHWNPALDRKNLRLGGVDTLRQLVQSADLSVLGSDKRVRALLQSVDSLRSQAVLGHGTWNALGDSLCQCVGARAPGELERPTHRITREFLQDLRRRQLWACDK
jgi:hypothetical protein